jgi:hypothetical protein
VEPELASTMVLAFASGIPLSILRAWFFVNSCLVPRPNSEVAYLAML